MPDGRELSRPHTARRPTAERGLSTKVEPENGHSSAATRARVRCDQVQTSPQPRQPAQLREPKPSDTPMGVSRVPTSVVYGQCNGEGYAVFMKKSCMAWLKQMLQGERA